MARTNRNTTTPAAIAIAAGFLMTLAATAEPNPLAGPSVEADPAGETLSARNIDGSMRRPEIPVAEAALRTVDLDPTTQSKVDALLADRAKQIDAIVRTNLETLNTMRTDRTASAGENARKTRRAHAKALMEMFRPVLEKGPLEEQIAAVLPEATRVTYLSHIDEHREMLIADRRARGPRGGEGPGDRPGARGPRRGGPPGMEAGEGPMLFEDPMLEMLEDEPGERGERAERGERRRRGPGREGGPGERAGFGPAGGPRELLIQLGDLRHEIRRSVERLTGEKEAARDDLFDRLDLEPGQETRVRELMGRLRATRDAEAPRAERREVMRELAEILTPEQRRTLRESMGGRRGPRDGAEGRRRPGRRAPADDE